MPTQSFAVTVVRPEDLLILNLEFRHVDFVAPTAGQVGQIKGQAGAYLIVHFQPQHIAEEAFFQSSGNVQQTDEEKAAGQPPPPGNETPAEPGFVRSLLAGPSRLVFTIPSGETIPYTLADLLDALPRLPLSVSPVSSYEPYQGCSPLELLLRLLRIPPPPAITPPADTVTAIEAPYRLYLSPDHFGWWEHATQPVTRGPWTELWHTRLGSRRPDGDPRVRAIWSPDYQANTLQNHYDATKPGSSPDPFRMSLDARDRNEVVHLTASYYLPDYTPTPVDTERIMLSTLGAWLDFQGDWDPPSLPSQGSLTVEQWRHEATMARDHYVRVMYAGYLFPFGHRASLVKVTERKFYFREDTETPGFVAYLFQRMFIIVREPTRSYSHRTMPFRTVTFRTRVTPNLADPATSQVTPPGKGQEAFWPRVVAGAQIVDFQFHLTATDWEGRRIELTAPLIFVSKNVDEIPADIQAVVNQYKLQTVTGARRQRPLNGQSVAFAPAKKPNDTTLETAAISLDADHQPGSGKPHFRPAMAQASVDIPAVQQLLKGTAVSTIQWEPTYTAAAGQAFGNAGLVFARVTNSPALNFATDRAGGLVAPNISISGLSRALGPVGGPVGQMVAGNFRPKDIFDLSIKLLGGIELRQIIKDFDFSNAANTDERLPQLTTVRDGDLIRTTYSWKLGQGELVNTGLFVPNAGAQFILEAIVEKKLDNSPPIFRIEGRLTNFSVVLLPKPNDLVSIDFNQVMFKSVKDEKVEVDVQLKDVRFLGILAFVNQLQKFIPLDGFSDPPNLSIGPAGIDLGFTLGIPTIGIGVMTIQNISLTAGFFLPFGNKQMNFHFAFCERQQPFILTVSLFGGGGFFSIDIGIKEVVLIEAALEFGASAAINLGVASGQATIMAGFYFQKAGADFSLTGYFRASGSLSVLGIITVSLEFYLGLTYASKGITPHGGTLWGQAKLTVKIEILFFSTSVSVSMEREFAGSDPTFRQLVAPSDWVLYCEAFADYV